MNTCPTCGRPRINGSVYFLRDTSLAFLADSIVIDGQPIRLTPCEYVVAKVMCQAIGREPVPVESFIRELYAYHEPEHAEGCIKTFIFHLRQKLNSTDLGIRSYPPRKYGFVEAQEAA